MAAVEAAAAASTAAEVRVACGDAGLLRRYHARAVAASSVTVAAAAAAAAATDDARGHARARLTPLHTVRAARDGIMYVPSR